MNKIKISVVSYLNSKPFLYGLNHSELINEIDLQLDIPSVCAKKLIDGQVDIGLIPVAVLPKPPVVEIDLQYARWCCFDSARDLSGCSAQAEFAR